jgi:thymidylate kinase
MRATKLILFEGIPGSGKSTTGQFVARQIERAGHAVRWWYEEEANHPLHTFHDWETMQAVVDDLARGRSRPIIDAVLERWERLAGESAASDRIVVHDSALLGHLTWTLFPFDVPRDAILAYVARVEQIIRPCDPVVIYFTSDVSRTLRRVCDARGGGWEQGMIRRVQESPYGRRNGLTGFSGLVAYWATYGKFADELFARLSLARLRLQNASENWLACRREILHFLGLPLTEDAPTDPDPARFVGVYGVLGDAASPTWEVTWEDDGLVARGLPWVWPRVHLLPTASSNEFVVESYPCVLTFEVAGEGTVPRVRVSGRALLGRAPEGVFERRPVERQG